jgi:cytidylate kinase
MYRAVTVAALDAGLDPADTSAVAALADTLTITTRPRVTVNGRDVEDEIRTDRVNVAVSLVAANADVRASMVRRQRQWARDEPVGTVVEGRDITTVVFPNAPVKVYLTASAEERARRRGDESAQSVARRDAADTSRDASPLRQAHDALVVDTTGREVDDVVEEIIECLTSQSS